MFFEVLIKNYVGHGVVRSRLKFIVTVVISCKRYTFGARFGNSKVWPSLNPLATVIVINKSAGISFNDLSNS